MKMKRTWIVPAIALTTTCLAILGIVAWRLRHIGDVKPNPQIVFLRDRSISLNGSPLDGVVRYELSAPEYSGDVTVLFLDTGDSQSANEPVMVGQYNLPSKPPRAMEINSNEDRYAAMLSDVKARYAQISLASVSPLYVALLRAVEQAKTMGPRQEKTRRVVFLTDLEETSDAQIKAALASPPGTKISLDVPIDNAAISVTIYGAAQTMGQVGPAGKARQLTKRRDPKHIERLNEVWLSVFTNKENVRIEPFQPQPITLKASK